MTEIELLKALLRQVAKIDTQMVRKDDLSGVIEQLIMNEEQIDMVQHTIEYLKQSVELKHLENINSDEFLLRSIKQVEQL